METGVLQIATETTPLQGETVRGLTVLTATVFIVGEVAGTGILALSKAVEDTGSWIGLVLIALFACLSGYTGTILSRSWNMVQERYPDYRGHVRSPYPVMGQITYGKPGRYIVSFCIGFTMFGSGVVFLLAVSENIQDLVSRVSGNFSFCYWCVIVAAVLTPVAWLGTPKDFWPLAVMATVSTTIAAIILLVNISSDALHHPPTVVAHSAPKFVSFFGALGTITFGMGGHPWFLSYQTDMIHPAQFKKAIWAGYASILLLYLPVAVAGYLTYGAKLTANILDSVSTGPMFYSVIVFITLHLFFATIIAINPVFQALEDMLGISRNFTWKRCITRTLVMGSLLFVAETIPHFGTVLSLVGGSTNTLLSCVFPSVFYLKMCSMKSSDDTVTWTSEHVPLHVRVMNYEIIVVGVFIGVAATVSTLITMLSSETFTVPCYVNVTAASG